MRLDVCVRLSSLWSFQSVVTQTPGPRRTVWWWDQPDPKYWWWRRRRWSWFQYSPAASWRCDDVMIVVKFQPAGQTTSQTDSRTDRQGSLSLLEGESWGGNQVFAAWSLKGRRPAEPPGYTMVLPSPARSTYCKTDTWQNTTISIVDTVMALVALWFCQLGVCAVQQI